MGQRKWTVDDKLSIVMEGLKGIRSVSDICREHKLSQTQYYKWRDRFLEGGKRGLVNGYEKVSNNDAEIERLQQIIGKQAVQIEVLKKTEKILGIR